MAMGENGMIAALVGVKVTCCGGLVLAATGTLAGVGAWLGDAGPTWLRGGGLMMAAALIAWWHRRRRRQARPERSLTDVDSA